MNRVFTLQRALVQDQDRLASTRGEVALYLIAVYKAIGGGWEIRQGGVPTVVAQMDQPVAVPAEVAPSPTEAVPSPTETLGTETE
jgi:hypothetical protein